MRYKRHITFLATLAIISLLINERAETGANANEVVAGQWVELSPARKVPSTSYAIEGDKRQSLPDFKGTPVLLNFWATWCVPCLKELPTLDALAKKRDDIKVVTISIDSATIKQLRGFLDKRGLALQHLGHDDSGKLYRELSAKGLPLTYLINKDGMIVNRFIGATDWTAKKHEAVIDAVVKSPASAKTSARSQIKNATSASPTH